MEKENTNEEEFVKKTNDTNIRVTEEVVLLLKIAKIHIKDTRDVNTTYNNILRVLLKRYLDGECCKY
jgi:hypothetical protein